MRRFFLTSALALGALTTVGANDASAQNGNSVAGNIVQGAVRGALGLPTSPYQTYSRGYYGNGWVQPYATPYASPYNNGWNQPYTRGYGPTGYAQPYYGGYQSYPYAQPYQTGRVIVNPAPRVRYYYYR